MQLRGVVLVEGTSDRRAVETLARRRGRDLQAEGVAVVPMGGYGNLPRLLRQYRDLRIGGLYDVGEERYFLRALGCDDRGELERVGFYACTRDLEEELHGFMWNRKQRYAVLLVEALDPERVPWPLDRVLAHV